MAYIVMAITIYVVMAKVEGGIAHDVYTNFAERWRRVMWQSRTMERARKKERAELCPALADLPVAAAEDDVVTDGAHHDAWTCQLLRSSDRDAVGEANGRTAVEDHIHQAYCHHIRRAKKL